MNYKDSVKLYETLSFLMDLGYNLGVNHQTLLKNGRMKGLSEINDFFEIYNSTPYFKSLHICRVKFHPEIPFGMVW